MKKVVAGILLAVAIGCLLFNIWLGCATVQEYIALGKANASGHEYLSIGVGIALGWIISIVQLAASGICLVLADNNTVRKLAGIGGATAWVGFIVCLFLIFFR